MRVLQLIDSLEAGGAERMAVNYANSLSKKLTFSGLAATRREGQLFHQIHDNVSYIFLDKKKKVDLKAVFKLRKYIIENKVDVLHAHSTSFFTAVLVKCTFLRTKIVWHDHYGTREKETKRQNKILFFLSLFFSSVFVVNYQLRDWSRKNLLCKNVVFIPNFTLDESNYVQATNLKGKEGRRIVFLANLKNPKNHFVVLKAFRDLKLHESGWSLHLIGRDYLDLYSEELKDFIKFNSLQDHIHLYGEKKDIKYILSQADIGILASTNEGFPVTLLEYAMSGLGVITSNVGFCPEIIQNDFNGLLFNPLNDEDLKSQLSKITEDELLRKNMIHNLKSSVAKNYSEEVVIEKLITEYKKVNK